MTNAPSFLPDDYVRDARERRNGVVALLLFVVVMGAVFAAFLVTNRQWSDVRLAQAEVNERTEQAAKEIAEMKRLEAMRGQMIEKAELARGLIEPVPRSVLLATLVNTMPEELSLLDLELKSEEIKATKPANATGAAKTDAKADSRADQRARRTTAGARGKEPEQPPKPEPVRRRVLVNATGVAPNDLDVSRWMSQLSRMPFLSGIRLEVSEEKELRGRTMRQFRISMRIEPNADVRGWDGIEALRAPKDPIGRGVFADGTQVTPSRGNAAELDPSSNGGQDASGAPPDEPALLAEEPIGADGREGGTP